MRRRRRARARVIGMVNLGEALDLLFTHLGDFSGSRGEAVPLRSALGRVLAADVVAVRPVPEGPRAAMDGFAVASAGLQGRGAPRTLCLAGRVLAGGMPPPLPAGGTVFVATGAPLPPGADAVVPRELAAWDAAGPDGGPAPGTAVTLRQRATAGDHVMPPGEWVPAGAVVLRAGVLLTPPALGLLATLGKRSVRVRRRPTVAILATGDELVAPGRPLPPGGIYDSNTAMLQAACAAAGARASVLPRVPDHGPALRAALAAALEREPALVLTSGGVSVGPADLVPAVWRALGAEELFWRVAIKPGKPVFAARLGATAVLGLSGSPTACWTAFQVLAGPLLRHWAGLSRPFPAPQRVRLTDALSGSADMLRLLWSAVGTGGDAAPPVRRAPGVLLQMASANALLLQAAGSGPLAAGAAAWALRLDRIGEAGETDARALLAAAARPGALGDGGTRAVFVPPALPPAPPADQAGAPPPAGRGQVTAPAPAWPAVCAVGGRSGHGKTTLVERLIAAFTAAGEPVATVKHHGHGTPLDAPGKDGFRHRAAGARLTVVAGTGGILWSEAVPGDPALEAWLPALRARAAEAGCRWLLVEGYHQMHLPRVEVLDTARAAGPHCAVGHGLFLIAATNPAAAAAPAGVPVLARDDVAAVAAAIRRTCLPG